MPGEVGKTLCVSAVFMGLPSQLQQLAEGFQSEGMPPEAGWRPHLHHSHTHSSPEDSNLWREES